MASHYTKTYFLVNIQGLEIHRHVELVHENVLSGTWIHPITRSLAWVDQGNLVREIRPHGMDPISYVSAYEHPINNWSSLRITEGETPWRGLDDLHIVEDDLDSEDCGQELYQNQLIDILKQHTLLTDAKSIEFLRSGPVVYRKII